MKVRFCFLFKRKERGELVHVMEEETTSSSQNEFVSMTLLNFHPNLYGFYTY